MNNIKISKESFTIFLLIFFSLKISCLAYIFSFLNYLLVLGSSFVSLFSIYYLLKNKKVNKIDVCTLLFYFILFVATFINNGDFFGYIKELLAYTSLYFSMRYGLEKNAKSYINIFSNYLLFLIVLNTLSALLTYPNAMILDNNNPIFILGGDNTSVRLYIVSVLFCFLDSYIKNGKYKMPKISFLCFLIFSILRDLGGGKLCLIVMFLILLYFIMFKKLPNKIVRKIIITNIILFFILVVFNRMDVFRFIIEDILHRNLSLTDRTIIWDVTIEKILEKPIIGYGMIPGLEFQAMLPYITGINAHNTFLMVFFSGGFLLFSIFIITILISAYKFDMNKHKKWIYILPIAFLVLTLRAQIEGWDVLWFFMFAGMIYSCDKIEKIKD